MLLFGGVNYRCNAFVAPASRDVSDRFGQAVDNRCRHPGLDFSLFKQADLHGADPMPLSEASQFLGTAGGGLDGFDQGGPDTGGLHAVQGGNGGAGR